MAWTTFCKAGPEAGVVHSLNRVAYRLEALPPGQCAARSDSVSRSSLKTPACGGREGHDRSEAHTSWGQILGLGLPVAVVFDPSVAVEQLDHQQAVEAGHPGCLSSRQPGVFVVAVVGAVEHFQDGLAQARGRLGIPAKPIIAGPYQHSSLIVQGE